MAARIFCTLIFWILMTFVTLGAVVVVFLFYLPFVALKAVWLAVTGRLHEATAGTSDGSGTSGSVART